MSNVEKFKAAKEIVRKAQEEANQVVKEAFSDMAKIVFEQNPELKGFRWTQYTPYFNDGNSCEFGVNDFELLHPEDQYNELSKYEEEERGGYHDCLDIIKGRVNYLLGWYRAPEGYTSPLRKAYNSVKDFLHEFDESDLEKMFGDHVEITVTPEGVEVDGYSHD